ncbi:MAG: serine hydrolase domain-containing protein [Candidatus Omnitrophota bacterium]
MKKKLFFPCLVAAAAVSFFANCYASDTQKGTYQAKINSMLSDKWHSYTADKPNLLGAVAIYITSPKGNFYANTDTRASNINAHFRIASATKTFTAASIMLLNQQGKLNINDLITAPIPGSKESYAPNMPDYNIPYKNQITIKMLLNHRAGVFDVDNNAIPKEAACPYAGRNYVLSKETVSPEHTFTFDELLGVVAACDLKFFPPNTDYHYSDTGYSLLGKIIERVSGKRYSEFVRDNFLIPNSLNQTSLPYLGSDTKIPVPYETGYAYDGATSFDVTEDNMSVHVSEGNVITTVLDLANWIRKLVRGEAGVSADTVKLMTAEIHNPNVNYGLGISTVPGLGYGHEGGTNGYLTVARYDPRQDVTVIISASVINWKDYVTEMYALYDIGRAAKNILGYSTEEKF